jgi:peptidoglycan/LPS O-acetylase OafA/YrhL
MTQGFLIGIALDIVVIPWSYVFANYVRKPGDRWRRGRGRDARVGALSV